MNYKEAFFTLALLIVNATAALTITSNPDSAQVFENEVHIGTTPFVVLDSTAITHKFTMKKLGYRDTTFFEVGSSVIAKSVHVAMRSEQVFSGITLNVKTRHPHAQIFINDSLQGTDSTTIRTLSPGKYTLRIEGYNIVPIIDTLNLVANETTTFLAPSVKQRFTLLGLQYSRDFRSFDFTDDVVFLDRSKFVLSHEFSTRGQRDFALYFGSSHDHDNRGVQFMFHVPHKEKFTVYTADSTDSLRVKSMVAGGGILREYLYTVAAIPKIAQIDLGCMWGIYGKLNIYRYRSSKSSGGLDEITLENSDGIALVPLRGFASAGGAQARALIGYKHAFLSLSYQFLPSIAFDGISGYPDKPISFLPVQRTSASILAKF